MPAKSLKKKSLDGINLSKSNLFKQEHLKGLHDINQTYKSFTYISTCKLAHITHLFLGVIACFILIQCVILSLKANLKD